MSPLQIGAVVGLLVAGGVWALGRAWQRAPRSLAAARQMMSGEGARGRTVQHAARSWQEVADNSAASRWVAQRFGGGLQMVGLSPGDVVTRVVTAAGVALVAVGLAAAAGFAAGSLSPSPLWLPGALAVAAAFGWIMLSDVSSRIERRRRELRQAANDFVQLVAVGLTTDQSVEGAIRFALDVGGGEAFELLRAPVIAAPQRGIPVWEALEELGLQYEVRELVEFAVSVERQGLHGVSIGETVATLATAMRAKALDELERDADKANANLSGPTVGFVVATIVFLAYPLALRISEAFGG